MRKLISAARALMASALVLFASLGAGAWQLCLDTEGQLQLKSIDADCNSVCTSDEPTNEAARSDACGGLDGATCCTDFSAPFYSPHSRHRGVDLVWSFPAPVSTPAMLALTHAARLPKSRICGPNGPLAAHRTVVLRL